MVGDEKGEESLSYEGVWFLQFGNLRVRIFCKVLGIGVIVIVDIDSIIIC